MEIIRIFENEDCLLSALYDGEIYDEFTRVFDILTNIEELERFFENNSADLEREYWSNISIEEAILNVRKEAILLRKHFLELVKIPAKDRIEYIRNTFKPLDSELINKDNFERKKVYGKEGKSFIRIYALCIDKEIYLISGGTIKLTDNMQEREHTKNELSKLDKCKQYLINEGIVDKDGLIDLLEM